MRTQSSSPYVTETPLGLPRNVARGRRIIRASFCKNSGRTQPRELHPGKRDFAPRDFGQYGKHIGPRDRRSVTGGRTSSRQPAEPSGFFKPAFVLPVRGDWLVVEVVPPNRSLQVKLPANRENNRESCQKNASNRLVLWPQVQENQWVNAKLPYAYEQGVYFTEQGGGFSSACPKNKPGEGGLTFYF
jgi:hypothetical protein